MTTREILSESKQYQQQRQSYRPHSASQSERYASSNIGKNAPQQGTFIDEQTVKTIWKGFGSYIAKQLRNGKGVTVPKFGNITFSATNVDLAGTTNPGERDKQHRDPVFIVGKDFVSATSLRAGIAYNNGTQVRPNEIKGVSGIIPKVKINYTEVGSNCGYSKDVAKNGCEQMFRYLSDRVRRGENLIQMEIPFVGQFIVKSNIAAISFKEDLSEETKGATAKGHYVNKLFASSANQLNLQIHDQTTAKGNPSNQMGGAMALTSDAENWLRNNLNISVQELVSNGAGANDFQSRTSSQRIQSAHPKYNSSNQLVKGLTRYGSMKPEDLRHKSWALGNNNHNSAGLTEQNKAVFDRLSEQRSGPPSKRPMSAATRTTSQASRLINVPELGRMKIMIIANDIYRNRAAISEVVSTNKRSLRDPLSSSEIHALLKRTGIFIELGHLKASLKEFGFNWNGVSCSFFDLFKSCQTFMYGTTQDEARTNTYYQAQADGSSSVFNYEENPLVKTAYNYNKRPDILSSDQGKDSVLILSQIKDLFYSTGKGIFEIFNEAKLGSVVDYEGLNKIVQAYSQGRVDEEDVKSAFKYITKGRNSIGYQEFEKTFKWELPSGGEWETKAIRSIREWMYKNGLASETAFQFLLKNAGKLLQKKLNRVDFHKALSMTELRFSAVEIDGLFLSLDINEDGELDIDEWKTRIYEDSSNPLQMLREIISLHKLTPDDLLFKMKLRIWDAPLDFIKLCESLRRLDPTLSETQLRHLAKVLKNKDNKVEITSLLRNLSGKEYETVDFGNKIFRQIYSEIHPNKEDQLLQLLENSDPLNDGRVEPIGLKIALNKVLKNSIDEQNIDRFIRFLEKDKSGKIPYMDFMQRMAEVSNREHNPFKAVVQRLAYFLESNKQSIGTLIKRLCVKNQERHDTLSPTTENGASINTFTQFLKAKIDKKRDEEQLRKFAHLMDIDKDGIITEIDLQTCLSHLNSDTFFRNNGEALGSTGFSSVTKFFPGGSNNINKTQQLSEERAFEVLNQIRTSLISQKIAYREAFNRFDSNQDGFLNFNEFSQGLGKVITLSAPIKEKLFALMDKNQIGLVDYPNFLETIQMSSANRPKKDNYRDNFNWENDVIEKIRQWIISEKVTIDEAFKCFDKDFDGFINKEDLKWGLTNILKIPLEELFPTKIDRLFRLMDFYKTNCIQLSDFQRLIKNENPYTASTGAKATASSQYFKKSFGGTYAQTNTFDWKLSAIQQIGLVISKKFNTLKDSFEEASERLQKVTYEQFKKFLEQYRTLSGFNLTTELIQKLFSEIDPHKKGYLTENDWSNAFQAFNWNDQIFIELKNAISCNFTDCDSSFDFFHTFKKDQQSKSGKKSIQYPEFELAVNSLTSERFKRNEIQSLWKHLTEGGKFNSIDNYQFRSHFDDLRYTGNATVNKLKSAPSGARATIRTATSSSSTWEVDILEKLRSIMKSSSLSFEDIFRSFDSDSNGYISEVEFRNAIRKLNLGLTSREIDKIMERIDTNQDGRIDWQEFVNKFKTKDLDVLLKERAKDKMGRLKELMILHMTSPNDAFRFFDETKLGKLSYQEFGKLMIKLYELAGEKPPAYPVIKDLFDTIDIRKDGIIDISEWQQTFGAVTEGNNKLSMKPTPMTNWINSREFMQIGSAIAKNRRLLKEKFEGITGGKGTEVTFKQAKQAMDTLIFSNFKGLSDEKLLHILKVGESQAATSEGLGGKFDYLKMLDIYKNRHAAPQL